LAKSGRNVNHPIKRTLLASADLERLGCNPIEEIHEAMLFAKDMTKKGGTWTEKGTDQSNWAALWLRGAEQLASYRYPKLSAVAIADMGSGQNADKQPLSTAEAIKVLANDPFAPQALKSIDTDQVIDAMAAHIDKPFLPSGNRNE